MKVYFDGGCVPNPGVMSACVVIDGGKTYYSLDFARGTNNIAEWTALTWACEICTEHELKDVTLIGDSKLVVMQADDQWKIKHAEFIPYKQKFDLFRATMSNLQIKHVLRAHNLAGHYLESVGR